MSGSGGIYNSPTHDRMGNHTLPETSSTYCKTQRVVQLASLECKKAYSYLIETETKSKLHALVLSKDLLGEHSIFSPSIHVSTPLRMSAEPPSGDARQSET